MRAIHEALRLFVDPSTDGWTQETQLGLESEIEVQGLGIKMFNQWLQHEANLWVEILDLIDKERGGIERFVDQSKLAKLSSLQLLLKSECVASPRGRGPSYKDTRGVIRLAAQSFVSGNGAHVGAPTSVLGIGYERWSGAIIAMAEGFSRDLVVEMAMAEGVILESADIIEVVLGRGDDVILRVNGRPPNSAVSGLDIYSRKK